MKLTKGHMTALSIIVESGGFFHGFPAGSNLWPLTALGRDHPKGPVDGELIDELLRGGLLATRPIDGVVRGDRSPNLEYVPDLDFEHEVFITPAGRTALQQAEDDRQ